VIPCEITANPTDSTLSTLSGLPDRCLLHHSKFSNLCWRTWALTYRTFNFQRAKRPDNFRGAICFQIINPQSFD